MSDKPYSRYEIGDAVRVIAQGSPNWGVVCIVTSALLHGFRHRTENIKEEGFYHSVNIPTKGMPFGYKPSELAPVHDGEQPTTWDQCNWKPFTMRNDA